VDVGVLAPEPAPKLMVGAGALPAPKEKGVVDDWPAALSVPLAPKLKEDGVEVLPLPAKGLLKDVLCCVPPALNVNDVPVLPTLPKMEP
jgi:hypothetical protein